MRWEGIVLNIAICDDNKEFTGVMEEYLHKAGVNVDSYDVFYNGKDLLSIYNKGQAAYDVIFLDMELGDSIGIEIATQISKLDEYVLIVFVTSYKKYMLKSFDCHPFSFLVKPLKYDKFKETYDKICARLKDKPQTITIEEKHCILRLFCDHIVYAESDKHFLNIYTKDGEIHRVRKTMKEFISVVDAKKFVKVHRGYIVNLKHIYKIFEDSIIVHNAETKIPLSHSFKDELYDKFITYKERMYTI